MKAAGSKASLIGGIGTVTYAMAVAMLALLAIAMIGLLVRALATSEFTGALFLVGIARLVCLDHRRLHQAQPAAQLFVRRTSRDIAAVAGFAIKRHET